GAGRSEAVADVPIFVADVRGQPIPPARVRCGEKTKWPRDRDPCAALVRVPAFEGGHIDGGTIQVEVLRGDFLERQAVESAQQGLELGMAEPIQLLCMERRIKVPVRARQQVKAGEGKKLQVSPTRLRGG